MKILVVNCGSSSLKYQLFDMTDETVVAKGIAERIGAGGIISGKTADGRSYKYEIDLPDHKIAFKEVQKNLTEGECAVISSMSEIAAVGHRIVQGGALFDKSVLVDDEVIKGIESLIDLAPLHNAAHLQGIRACIDVLGPDVPEVTVFDNCFHLTMPPEAYMFAVPYEYYEKYKVRRYGFHGTSHGFVSKEAIKFGNLPADAKVIVCHIGNGASISASVGGKCVDTSMGLTPLEGLIMGTRSGDLDPAVIQYICNKENKSVDEVLNMLNKKSGLLGMSGGLSSDCRDITAAAEEGHHLAKVTLDAYTYRIAKYVGAYAAAMNGVDAIAFTAGVGENDIEIREELCEKYWGYLGVKIDKEANHTRGENKVVSTADSKVKVMVIPTNEELAIARDTLALI